MGNYELIEELCSVARLQADIIQKQAEAIAQAEIAESVAADLAEKRKQAADSRPLRKRALRRRRLC